MTTYSKEQIQQFFEQNDIPADFEQWTELTDDGIPVAHAAAERGILPDNFTDWALRAPDGRTVAHYWARERPMPDGFAQYGLTDAYGNSVQEVCEARNLNEQQVIIGASQKKTPNDIHLKQETIAPRPGTFQPFHY